MTARVLIRGGYVLTLGAKTPNFTSADVLIEGGQVAEVGEGLRARDAEVIDAVDGIVMPGFVDSHRHVWKSLFRNRGTAAPNEITGAALAEHFAPEDVYAATLIGLLGAIEAGITTVVDWCDIQLNDAQAAAALEAHADSGMRTVFAAAHVGGRDEGSDGARLRQLAANVGSVGPNTTLAMGSSDVVPSSLERLGEELGLARQLGMRIHTHAGTAPEGRGSVFDLGERSLLGEDVTLVHGSHLADEDFDAIAASNAAISITPASEMASGLGSPPMQQLIDRGIRPGLGVDDEQLSPGDIFSQMRAANSVQHATLFDLKLAGKAGVPTLLNTRDVLRYATVDGARAAGLAGSTGSLEPGMAADVLVLRTDRPNIYPINDPIGAVVWGMDTSNVDWLLAAGRPLVRNGSLTADVARAGQLAREAQIRVGAAAGLLVGTKGGPR